VSHTSIHPDEFVTAVKPLLETQDLCGLLQFLKSRWTAEQIVELLKSRHCDARKVAALALSLVGGACCLGPLSEQLKDPDPVVNEMAEHALWSIWFRSGSCEANHQLCKGAQAMERQELDESIGHFTRAIEIDPQFAEAYNQRAIAHYLQDHLEDSIADCRRTTELMPCHFGAWAGLGHGYAHLGRIDEALACYKRSLTINPHFACVVEAYEELKRQRDGE
jgi:tetratricopeptide (TPR) repeat protein